MAVLPACTVEGGDEIPVPLFAYFVGTGERVGLLGFGVADFSPSSESERINTFVGESGRLLEGVTLTLRHFDRELDSLSDDECKHLFC